MDSAFIHQAANELVQNAGTRNIKQIARSCSLDISETSRIKDMLGLLSLYFDKPLILINRQLDKQTKQMVCGYALGHYLEHQLLSPFCPTGQWIIITARIQTPLTACQYLDLIIYQFPFMAYPLSRLMLLLSNYHFMYRYTTYFTLFFMPGIFFSGVLSPLILSIAPSLFQFTGAVNCLSPARKFCCFN